MIDPAISWFKIVELPVSQLQELDIPTSTKGQRSKDTHVQTKQPYFDKTSATVGNLINRTWFSRYPLSQSIIYNNRSEFKLHFETLCDSYGLKRKPTSVRNPQANGILERVHQTITAMLHTADLDMPMQSARVTLLTFSQTLHGPFALPITQTKNLTRSSYLWKGHVV
eukprot:CCRYP_013580-RA/>CCRYP_013580-RA protein AED:0.47 eAED:0.61 QI:0/-1/0/1/-1/0/1/0/167